MKDTITFLCPRCKEKHPITDIAYSLPDEVATLISQKLATLGADQRLVRQFNQQKELLTCIRTDELMYLLEDPSSVDTFTEGTLYLDVVWLAQKLQDCPGLSDIDLSGLPGDEVLYSRYLQFQAHQVGEGTGAVYVPDLVLDENRVPISRKRVCCHCGKELCLATGTAPEISVILQGSARAGKTACMISMIGSFQDHSIDPKKGIYFDFMDSGHDERYAELIRELKHWKAGYAVVKTPTGQEAEAFSISMMVDGEPLVLTFIDMPGEVFNSSEDQGVNDEWFKEYGALYEECDAIWTVLDKLMLTGRPLTDADKDLQEQTGDSPELLQMVSEASFNYAFGAIQNAVLARRGTLPPSALILSKSDLVVDGNVDELVEYDLFPQAGSNAPEVASADRDAYESILDEHPSCLNERNFFDRSNLIRQYFAAQNLRLANIFERYNPLRGYFAMAAYGHKAVPRPKGSDQPLANQQAPTPYNVRLPLLWTLAVTGHLPVKYTLCTVSRNTGFLNTILGRAQETVDYSDRKHMLPRAAFRSFSDLLVREDFETLHNQFRPDSAASIRNLCMTDGLDAPYIPHRVKENS